MKKLYDEINYDLCSAKLASDYSRGYNTALKKIKKYIEDNYPECVYFNLDDIKKEGSEK